MVILPQCRADLMIGNPGRTWGAFFRFSASSLQRMRRYQLAVSILVNVVNDPWDLSSVATCNVVSDPRDLSSMAIYHVRSTRNVNMPPHPTPPHNRDIQKRAFYGNGFRSAGINMNKLHVGHRHVQLFQTSTAPHRITAGRLKPSQCHLSGHHRWNNRSRLRWFLHRCRRWQGPKRRKMPQNMRVMMVEWTWRIWWKKLLPHFLFTIMIGNGCQIF